MCVCFEEVGHMCVCVCVLLRVWSCVWVCLEEVGHVCVCVCVCAWKRLVMSVGVLLRGWLCVGVLERG